jgi:hypothetical protein
MGYEDISLQDDAPFYSVLSRSIEIRPEDGLPASYKNLSSIYHLNIAFVTKNLIVSSQADNFGQSRPEFSIEMIGTRIR